jgi:hypothetical protein
MKENDRINNKLIKEYFGKFRKITFTSVKKFGELYYDEFIKLNKILNDEPCWESIQNVIIGIIFDKSLKQCKTCGKTISFSKWNNDYCSTKCTNNDPEVRKKIKETCLEKYGVENAAKSKQFKEKSKQTCLEKYGVENAAKFDKFKEKSKQTCLKKYGVEFTTQTKQMKEKSKQTCLEKYGMEHYTNIDKQINTTYEKSFEKFLNFIDIEPLFSFEDYTGINYKKFYKWKCKKCGNIFEDHMHSHYPRCIKCNPKHQSFSMQEKLIVDYIKSIYNDEIIENDRNLINPYELDIVIPKLKVAFEYNGNFWHSTSSPGFVKNKDRDFLKCKMCEEIGYHLIQIKEHDWIYKNEIIKNNLKTLLNQDIIDNNDYLIREITKSEFKVISEKYLIFNDASSIKIGCFNNNELISCITFAKNKSDYKLVNIIGNNLNIKIFNEILNYFEKTYNVKSLIATIDRNNIFLNIFNSLNFKKIDETKQKYYYFKNDGTLYSKDKCRFHKLKYILDNFDEKLSESENMANNGFLKLFNNGYITFNRINI